MLPFLLGSGLGCDPGSTSTDGPATPTATTADTATTGDSAALPTVQLTGVTTTPTTAGNGFLVEVTTDLPASVAVRCAATGLPEDVHLLESPTGTTHTWRLGGLAPSRTYGCLAAAVSPRGGGPIAFTLAAGPRPAQLVPMQVAIPQLPDERPAWLLRNASPCGGDPSQWLELVDPEGVPRWWTPLPPDLKAGLATGFVPPTTVFWGGGDQSVGRPRVLDLFDGETWDSAMVLTDWKKHRFHHEARLLPDGRLLSLETEVDHLGPAVFEGFQIRLHDPTPGGSVSFLWGSQQAVDAGELDPGPAVDDVWHANWADWVTVDGEDRLYVSLCNTAQILRIDPTTGHVVWTFGAVGDFVLKDTAGAPLPSDQFPQCQHGLEVDGDRLLVFDNGRQRDESRAVEYQLDEADRTATLLWEWGTGAKNSSLGDVDRLGPDRVLVTSGSLACKDPSTVTEIVPSTGEVVAKSRSTDSTGHYRAERIDGCDVFSSAQWCPERAARLAELAPVFEP